MSHRNAHTTFYGRLLIVRHHLDGWKQSQIAEAMGISRKCVHTWIYRYDADTERTIQVTPTDGQHGGVGSRHRLRSLHGV